VKFRKIHLFQNSAFRILQSTPSLVLRVWCGKSYIRY